MQQHMACSGIRAARKHLPTLEMEAASLRYQHECFYINGLAFLALLDS